MAAYGLYTHIKSNRRRSILLLIGLFFLVYVMVFAGAHATWRRNTRLADCPPNANEFDSTVSTCAARAVFGT